MTQTLLFGMANSSMSQTLAQAARHKDTKWPPFYTKHSASHLHCVHGYVKLEKRAEVFWVGLCTIQAPRSKASESRVLSNNSAPTHFLDVVSTQMDRDFEDEHIGTPLFLVRAMFWR